MAVINKKIVCSVAAIITLALSFATTVKSTNGNPLRFSRAAMEVMGNAEGCRRDPYLCPARVVTQGLGHTGTGVAMVQSATDAQIAKWFVLDQMDAQNCIEQNVENKIGEKLPQGVFDGIGSFVLNVGCTKFVKYTMYKYLLDKNYNAACYQLPRFVYAGETKLPGLEMRRQKELLLCLSS